MRQCLDCGRELPLDAFVRNRSAKEGIMRYCRPCWNARIKRNIERTHGSRKDWALVRRYGIDTAEVQRLIDEQGGVCAVCRVAEPKHVDHDHKTGRVRGILCFNCNRGLGYFQDSEKLLFYAIDYLEPLDVEAYCTP